MRRIFILLPLALLCKLAISQTFDLGNLTLINSAAQSDIDTANSASSGMLVYNSTTNSLNLRTDTEWVPFWELDGNSGVTSSHFLGAINNVPLSLKSNNTTMLQIGKRITLGLYDGSSTGLSPYSDSAASLVYVKGSGGVAALEFEASGASFYKPVLFTDANGNFKMRGSGAGTDFFELGSDGASNDGRLLFRIGDDGNEPMIFEKYNYTTTSYIEMLRLQGTGLNSTVRAGIGTEGAVPNSTLQVGGSFAAKSTTVASNTTLSDAHHTVILTNNSSITLPSASTCEGRMYIIKKTNIGSSTISSYQDLRGNGKTFITNGTYTFQSDGTNWQLIDKSTVYGTEFNLFTSTANTSFNNNAYDISIINGTTSVLPVGKYEITITYLWNHRDNRESFSSDFRFGSGASSVIHTQEVKDDASSELLSYSKTFYQDVTTAGTQNVRLRVNSNDKDANISEVTIKVIRVQ